MPTLVKDDGSGHLGLADPVELERVQAFSDMPRTTSQRIREMWRNGISLTEAAEKFASQELIEQLQIARDPRNHIQKEDVVDQTLSWFPAITAAIFGTYSVWQKRKYAEENVIRAMQEDLLARVIKGELIALGYPPCGNSHSKPKIIPKYLAQHKYVHFDLGEVHGNGLRYVEVRIFEPTKTAESVPGSRDVGRPSIQAKIVVAINSLKSRKTISADMLKKVLWDLIREECNRLHPDAFCPNTPSNRTIQRVIRNTFPELLSVDGGI